MTTYYRADVDFRDRMKPGHDLTTGYNETFTAKTLEELKQELTDWINADLDNAGQPIYKDTENGAQQVGKVYKYWFPCSDRNREASHVWRSAWVEITKVVENQTEEALKHE